MGTKKNKNKNNNKNKNKLNNTNNSTVSTANKNSLPANTDQLVFEVYDQDQTIYLTIPELEQKFKFSWTESLPGYQPENPFAETKKATEMFALVNMGGLGFGVIARRPIQKGEIIFYAGAVTNKNDPDDDYALLDIAGQPYSAKESGNIARFLQHALSSDAINGSSYMSAVLHDDFIKLLQEQKAIIQDANFSHTSITINGRQTFALQAVRDIPKGELAVWDYGLRYWMARGESGSFHLFNKNTLKPISHNKPVFINASANVQELVLRLYDCMSITFNTRLKQYDKEPSQVDIEPSQVDIKQVCNSFNSTLLKLLAGIMRLTPDEFNEVRNTQLQPQGLFEIDLFAGLLRCLEYLPIFLDLGKGVRSYLVNDVLREKYGFGENSSNYFLSPQFAKDIGLQNVFIYFCSAVGKSFSLSECSSVLYPEGVLSRFFLESEVLADVLLLIQKTLLQSDLDKLPREEGVVPGVLQAGVDNSFTWSCEMPEKLMVEVINQSFQVEKLFQEKGFSTSKKLNRQNNTILVKASIKKACLSNNNNSNAFFQMGDSQQCNENAVSTSNGYKK